MWRECFTCCDGDCSHGWPRTVLVLENAGSQHSKARNLMKSRCSAHLLTSTTSRLLHTQPAIRAGNFKALNFMCTTQSHVSQKQVVQAVPNQMLRFLEAEFCENPARSSKLSIAGGLGIIRYVCIYSYIIFMFTFTFTCTFIFIFMFISIFIYIYIYIYTYCTYYLCIKMMNPFQNTTAIPRLVLYSAGLPKRNNTST